MYHTRPLRKTSNTANWVCLRDRSYNFPNTRSMGSPTCKSSRLQARVNRAEPEKISSTMHGATAFAGKDSLAERGRDAVSGRAAFGGAGGGGATSTLGSGGSSGACMTCLETGKSKPGGARGAEETVGLNVAGSTCWLEEDSRSAHDTSERLEEDSHSAYDTSERASS